VALGLGSACGQKDGTAAASQQAESAAQAAAHPTAPVGDVPALTAEGLPEDLPIPDGLKAILVSSDEPGSTTALFTGDLDPDDVARSFAEGLRKTGWSIDESRGGSELGLLARKDQRVASVVVTRLSGKLHVELGLWAPPPK
jgi:hypothetical protein